jgi:hypothetical protein
MRLLMLNSAYDAVRQFQNKFSEKQTIREITPLFNDPKLDLTIHFESNLPWSLGWDVASNTLTGSCKITILPKLVINGELYEAPCKHDLVMPMDGFNGLEGALLARCNGTPVFL